MSIEAAQRYLGEEPAVGKEALIHALIGRCLDVGPPPVAEVELFRRQLLPDGDGFKHITPQAYRAVSEYKLRKETRAPRSTMKVWEKYF